jgi:hypothetical protein
MNQQIQSFAMVLSQRGDCWVQFVARKCAERRVDGKSSIGQGAIRFGTFLSLLRRFCVCLAALAPDRVKILS